MHLVSSRAGRVCAPSIPCALLLGFFALAPAACTNEETTAPSSAPTAATPAETPDASTDAETAGAASAACAAEIERLQEGLDAAHGKDSDAVLAIKTAACGLRVLTSGPSKLDGTELHRIGSVTKTYVAAVVLELAKEGKLGLDDAVSKWVENVPGGSAITLRHLLNHTSGLFNYTAAPGFLQRTFSENPRYTPRDLLDVAFARPPVFAPGERVEYSNTNYILLGLVAEKVGGAKLAPLIRARVLDPIGAKATFLEGDEPAVGTLVHGTSRVADPSALDMTWAWAAGAMVARPADLVTWTERRGSGAFHGIDHPELANDVPFATGIRYALGAMILDAKVTGCAGDGYGHTGGLPGAGTQAFYFPKKEMTVVALVASDEPVNDISAAALGVLCGPR